MRIPLTSYARREIILYGGLGIIVTAALAIFAPQWWYIAALAGLVTVWVFSFFRDPERRVPQGEELIISPADGTITAIERVASPSELVEADSGVGGDGGGAASGSSGGECLRISIFLSVFNCHLNRAPCAGRVIRVIYKVGRKVNAMRGDSAQVNERNTIIMQAERPGRAIGVIQISGAIARRIVCEAGEGSVLAAGERYGMIKFGSRTDLLIPSDVAVEIGVTVGQKVKAGLTVLGKFA